MLVPTRIYTKLLKPLLDLDIIKAAAHITGGGLIDNPPRMLAENLIIQFDQTAWSRPEVFNWLKKKGNLTEPELYRTFNLGIGFMCVVSPEQTDFVLKHLNQKQKNAYMVGVILEKN